VTIALIAALPAELKPLVRGWEKRGSSEAPEIWRGRIGNMDAVAACAGMGAAAATRACEALVAANPAIATLVSIGYAGSVSCGLQVGAAYPIREVIDAATGERFTTDNGQGQRLITLGRVADQDEKRKLASQHQAVLIDMEAAAVARVARQRNLRFLSFKGVSDGPNDKLPDFNRFVGADGQLRMAALAAWAALHPRYWKALGQLENNSRHAVQALATVVQRFFLGSP
jgi:adenosylhomocysteine nucleosidase